MNARRRLPLETLPDASAAAEQAARRIAARAREAVAARGRFILALSGGTTPRQMLLELAAQDVPWPALRIVQVDERVAPRASADRNLTLIEETLLAHAPLEPAQVLAMPVQAGDLARAARDYAAQLEQFAGTPPVLDTVHLGLGDDGHTASLVPDDAALGVTDADVAITGVYHGHRRMTLTYPALNRARHVLWLVSGASKAAMLARLIDGDAAIPAGRVERARAQVIADAAATQTFSMEGS